MATKMYCDICGQEKEFRQLGKMHLPAYPKETYGDHEADICKSCRDKRVLPLLREFRSSMTVNIDLGKVRPPEECRSKTLRPKLYRRKR